MPGIDMNLPSHADLAAGPSACGNDREGFLQGLVYAQP